MSAPTKEQIAKLPKWAQEAWDKREHELLLAKALAWPTVPEPKPMNIREMVDARPHGERLIQGWNSHAWALNWRVTLGCSNGVNHSSDDPKKTSTQGIGRFYATELEALIIARWELCRNAARAIAEIDKRILMIDRNQS